MSTKTSTRRTSGATPSAKPEGPSNSSSSADTIAAVAPKNDRRATLVAIRDRLAIETDDTLWAKHKRECNCQCGMGDGRLLVALVKELRATEAELASLPSSPAEVSELDRLADDLAPRRAQRRTATSGL